MPSLCTITWLAPDPLVPVAHSYIKPDDPEFAETERFLLVYQQAAARSFNDEEIEVAWAAGLWLAAHNARMELRHRYPTLVLDRLAFEAEERLTRAGA